MLRMSKTQGVNTVFSTSHFYAYDESPAEFIERRNAAFKRLPDEISKSGENFPKIIPGAELLYFPGICDAEDISLMKMGHTNCF